MTRAPRVLGIFSSLRGHRSFSDAMRAALGQLDVEATIVTLEPADFRRYPPPRWARVSEPLAGQAVLAAKLRYLWHAPYDVLLVNGWELLSVVRDIARVTPTAVTMDVSPRAAAREHRRVMPGWLAHVKSRLGEAVHAHRFDRDARQVDLFLPWTPWCGEQLTRDHAVPASSQRVTLLPIDTDTWCPAAGRRTPERPMILWAGNDWRCKGGPLLLAVYRKHLADHARLCIVGHDPEIAALPRIPGVTVYRRLPRERLPQLYREADIFALPTRLEYAGFVFAEACASGLPCVGPDIGGVSSVVRDAQTGFILPPEAGPELWADRLLTLVKNPHLRGQMSVMARRFAEDSLSLVAFTDRLAGALAYLRSGERHPDRVHARRLRRDRAGADGHRPG